MFNFGLFSSSIPYIMFVAAYLFYFAAYAFKTEGKTDCKVTMFAESYTSGIEEKNAYPVNYEIVVVQEDKKEKKPAVFHENEKTQQENIATPSRFFLIDFFLRPPPPVYN